MTTTYNYYTSTYYGNQIASDDWNRLASRADEKLTKYERLYTVSYFDDEHGRDNAICALAEAIQQHEDAAQSGGAVSSVSVGSVSTSFGATDISEKAFSRTCLAALRTYAEVYRGNNANS